MQWMKARYPIFSLLFLGLFPGCSEKVVNNSAPARVKINARLSSTEATGQFKYFTLIVTGPGIARPISGILLQVDGALEGEVEVPVGRSRRFIARGYNDRDEIIYSGQAVTDITTDRSIEEPVVIVLYPQVPLMKFIPRWIDLEMHHSFGVDTRIVKVDSVEFITFRVFFDGSVLRADSALLHPDLAALSGGIVLLTEIVDSFPDSYYELSIFNASDTGSIIIVDSTGSANLAEVYFTALGRESSTELSILPIAINYADVQDNNLLTERCTVNIGPLTQDIVVSISDPNLESAIRDALGQPSGYLYASQLRTISVLNASHRGIIDLWGIEFCANLTDLDLFDNNIVDIKALASLQQLSKLDLTLNMVGNLSALGGLTGLSQLWLGSNQISDIAPLADLTGIQNLSLYDNQISDLAPLEGMTALTWLELQGNQVTGIGPLAGLTGIQNLWISGNQISDISPLANMVALRLFSASGNNIVSISPLASLTELRQLYIQRNRITDVSPIASLTKLTSLMLGWNEFTDVSPLSGLTALVELNLESSRVTDFSPLADLTGLYQLRLSENRIVDIGMLSNMTNLLVLRLNRNRIRDIGPLSGLLNLQYLYLDSNQVNDINPLSGLTALDWLGMNSNIVFDVCPLLDNAGIAAGDTLDFKINPLSETSISECIPALQAKGVTVLY